MRLVRAVTTSSDARDEVFGRHVGHPDRELGLVVLERLVGAEPAANAMALALDDVLVADVRHAARILAALVAIDAAGDDVPEADGPLRRALADELDLLRQRVRANRLARHGVARLGPAMVELGAGGPSGALALEALGVLLYPAEAKQVLALLRPDLAIAERMDQLPAAGPGQTDLVGRLQDLVEDANGEWRSPWLRACAIHSARGRGVVNSFKLDAARALGDPIIEEVLGR
jgi:hypothetical protein